MGGMIMDPAEPLGETEIEVMDMDTVVEASSTTMARSNKGSDILEASSSIPEGMDTRGMVKGDKDISRIENSPSTVHIIQGCGRTSGFTIICNIASTN